MKSLIKIIITLLPLSLAQAQSVTGPGVRDEPPTAGPVIYESNKQEETSVSKEDMKTNPQKEGVIDIDSTNEQGPAGRQAQEAARRGEFKPDLPKEEVEKKQKGE